MCLIATTSFAQPKVEKVASVEISSVTPNIDGTIHTSEWSDATIFDDLYVIRPNEYATPSEKTVFYVKYTSQAIYVAAKVYEEDPKNIIAQITRQGANNNGDDGIRIMIDGYNTKQSGYMFGLSVNAVRNEGLFTDVNRFNDDWDGIWDGKTQRTDYGWSAEIEIPFKTLSFDPTSDAWSFNLLRDIARIDELSGWVSRNRSFGAESSGTLMGLQGMDQGLGLDVVPSLTLSDKRDYDPTRDNASFDPSLDLFYKITSGLNGSLTLNTDFSDAEVDDRQVDLTQFNLFFPEKRDFFLRDANVFTFGGIGSKFSYSPVRATENENARPFFSRRIGLNSTGEPVDLIAGGKLSGKLDQYDVGLLAVRQDEASDIDAETLLVGRVAVDVLDESSVGAVFTSGDPRSNIDNSLMGVDFRYRNSKLGNGKRLEANAWYQKTDTDGLMGDDTAYGLDVSMPNSVGWRGLAQYRRVEENFSPALGFVSRTGVQLYRLATGYIWRPSDNPWFRLIHAGADGRRWEFLDSGRQQSSNFRATVNLETLANDKLTIGIFNFGEGIFTDDSQPFRNVGIELPFGVYKWTRFGAILESSKHRKVDVKIALIDGKYYSGDRLVVDTTLGWRPNPKLRFQASLDYWEVNLPEGDFRVRIATANAEWAFNSTLSWVNVLQYDNISNNLGINSRLHWNPKAGQDVFLVLNHNFLDEGDDLGGFNSIGSDITVKASYTFRF